MDIEVNRYSFSFTIGSGDFESYNGVRIPLCKISFPSNPEGCPLDESISSGGMGRLRLKVKETPQNYYSEEISFTIENSVSITEIEDYSFYPCLLDYNNNGIVEEEDVYNTYFSQQPGIIFDLTGSDQGSLWLSNSYLIALNYVGEECPLCDDGFIPYGASAAYSLKKLNISNSNFTIPIKVRVDNGNPNTDPIFDIPFVDGVVSEQFLSVLALDGDGVATKNIYVTEWVDQSGNNNHAVQSDPSKQPRIVVDGEIVRDENGLPAIFFDGVDDNFNDIARGGEVDGETMICVLQSYSSDTQQRVLGYQGVTASQELPLYPVGEGASRFRINNGYFQYLDWCLNPQYDEVNTSNPDWSLFSIAQVDADLSRSAILGSINSTDKTARIFKNGVEGVSGEPLPDTPAFLLFEQTNITMGSRRNQSQNFFHGIIQELIIYESDHSEFAENIFKFINNRYNIY